jgi:hypothetical protein
LDTFADWSDPYHKGIVYYLDQGRVRGILLWNVWDQVDAAKEIIMRSGPISTEELTGQIPG